jgi:hypothetical protein
VSDCPYSAKSSICIIPDKYVIEVPRKEQINPERIINHGGHGGGARPCFIIM